MIGPIEWVEADVDDRPIFGPACPGPHIHVWELYIDDGVSIGSGCRECDWAIEPHEVAFEAKGHIVFEHEHDRYGGRCPNAMRSLPCDCNHWWRFVPDGSK